MIHLPFKALFSHQRCRFLQRRLAGIRLEAFDSSVRLFQKSLPRIRELTKDPAFADALQIVRWKAKTMIGRPHKTTSHGIEMRMSAKQNSYSHRVAQHIEMDMISLSLSLPCLKAWPSSVEYLLLLYSSPYLLHTRACCQDHTWSSRHCSKWQAVLYYYSLLRSTCCRIDPTFLRHLDCTKCRHHSCCRHFENWVDSRYRHRIS